MITIIGVPTSSSGMMEGVARGPSVLRRAGLIDVLATYCDVQDYGDVLFSQPIPEKSADSGVIAERSLVSMIYAVNNVLTQERFPLVIGGDCTILLGCLAAARDIHNHITMLFVDGHEDAYATYQSPTLQTWNLDLHLV